ncbi:DUF2523 family protein [Pseudomonas sp. UBA6310]|uniref:DUF2523 family protein n=1 Tax=Pseudomonas sp. UBA6310 TaxID=1947327 RepID=UPI0025805CDE|nr:DUF2523 family protein [Pseudomonas sp. UBA6310]
MEWISGFLDQIVGFFQSIWDFLVSGIYDFAKDGMVLLTKAAMYSYIQIQIFALDVAYTSAQEIIGELGIAQFIQQKYNGINGDLLSAFSFFGVPEALNIIFSALSTRFALRFVPFIGR